MNEYSESSPLLDQDNQFISDPHSAAARAFATNPSSIRKYHRLQGLFNSQDQDSTFDSRQFLQNRRHSMGDSLKSSDAFNTELYSSSHVDRQLFSKQRLSPDRNIPDDNILDESNDSKFLSGSVHDQIATSPFTYSSEVDFNYLPIITFFSLNIDKPRTSLTNNDTLPPRFTFYSETTGVIRAKQFSELNISMESKSIESILTSGPFWIDICQPTTLEMDEISRLFGLHPLTNEDIQTPDTREKCEVFSKYIFVVIRSFEQEQYKSTFMQPITIYIVIFNECVLSFQFTHNPHSRNVRSRIDQLSTFGLHVTTDWINYALIDDVTDSYIPLMKVIEREVDAIEELVLILVKETDQQDMLRRIGMVRKRVMQLLRLMNTKADVVKMIINRCLDSKSSNDTKFYLEDIHDHVLTMLQNLYHYEQSLARSHSNYLAQISIEITQASNRTSDTVMKMTLVASILVPLNIITGLWGMNVRVPGQDGDTLTWFYSIVFVMCILITVTYWSVRKAKLL